MYSYRTFGVMIFALLSSGVGASLHAQKQPAPSSPRVDVAFTYVAERSLRLNAGQNFWQQGGSLNAGISLWRNIGVAADLTGTHASSIGSSGVPLSLIVGTAGPRYRWHWRDKLSVYGQALFGEAYGFNSQFPTTTGVESGATAFALQVGGGVDYHLNKRFAVRALDAGWLRTQLPNAGSNTQNTLRLGAGVVASF